jgi:hypothetical protein
MNSLNAPRARPRRRSVNFRSFFRVLTCEATIRVVSWPIECAPGLPLRREFWRARQDNLRRMVARYLAREPERTIAP